MSNLIRDFSFFTFLLILASCVGYGVKTTAYPADDFCIRKSKPQAGWKQLNIYAALDSSEQYEVLARIVVTGDEDDSEEWLLRKLRKEAGRYGADAILHIHTKEVPRKSFNGVALALNVTGAVLGGGGMWIDMGGKYYTWEVEALAIRFTDED